MPDLLVTFLWIAALVAVSALALRSHRAVQVELKKAKNAGRDLSRLDMLLLSGWVGILIYRLKHRNHDST